MMLMDRSRRTSDHSKERGVALVVALCAVVLLTTLLFVFFSRAQLDQQIAFSSGSLLKADVFARSAADVITSELRAEIADTTDQYSTISYGGGPSSTYPPIYLPTKPQYQVPQPQGVSSPTGTLIMVSASGQPIRPITTPLPTTIEASSVSTSAPSQNGRLLTAARWFTSTTGSPQLGSQATLPTWVYVTHSGVETLQNPPSLAVDSNNKPAAADPQNAGYVTGRFAYAVYDTSGLLDANVAGYPTGTTYATNAAFKSSPAYADLTMLGMTSGTVSNFVLWRNPSTGGDPANPNPFTFDEWATGIPRTAPQGTPGPNGTPDPTAVAAAKSGHLAIASNAGTTPVVGDRAVLSRQDLLNNTSVYPSPSPTASPALTHFSRSVNGPSFLPATATTTNPNLPDVRWTTAGTITHYNDDGTSQTYTVAAGDPMLQRRFSLAKLAWITSAGPNAAAFASSANPTTAIQACFGLTWDPQDARWNYAAEDSSYAIKTLSEVATGNTEPNLFELLKAGIASGSLGQHSILPGPPTTSQQYTFAMPDQSTTIDPSTDAQILRIGTNMIDCQGADNYPTTTALNFGGATGTYYPVHGVKDLPYLSGVAFGSACGVQFPATVNPADSSNPNMAQMNWASLYMVPILFNPHRSSIPPTPTTATPVNVRIRIASGINVSVYNAAGGGGSTSGTPLARPNIKSDFSSDPPIVIPSSSFEAFRTQPQNPTGAQATSSTQLQTLLAAGSTGATATIWPTFHSFIYYAYTGLPEDYEQSITEPVSPTYPTGYDKYGVGFRSFPSDVFMVMEYQDSGGTYRIYDSMAGNEAYDNTTNGTGMGSPSGTANTAYVMDWLGGASWVSKNTNFPTASNLYLYQTMKIDPRTTRLGLPKGESFVYPSAGYSTSTVGQAPGGHSTRGFNYVLPFIQQGAPSGQFFYPELWPAGNESGWTASTEASLSTISNVADPDGVIRPADGWLGAGNSANLYTNLADQSRRPVILHRPFRSVGELGYVFRDSPWKTLNFFDSTSADAALLDIFSVSDEPAISAGRINLNGTQILSQQALLSGAATEAAAQPTPTPTPPSASAIASALNTYSYASGTPTANLPQNVAQLPSFLTALNATTGAYSTQLPVGTYPYKSQRESVVRALAGNTQTRTWNLLIDVVAQTGRYSSSATSLNNFIVDGEKRYWLSIALDRYTGKVVGRQMEPVNE